MSSKAELSESIRTIYRVRLLKLCLGPFNFSRACQVNVMLCLVVEKYRSLCTCDILMSSVGEGSVTSSKGEADQNGGAQVLDRNDSGGLEYGELRDGYAMPTCKLQTTSLNVACHRKQAADREVCWQMLRVVLEQFAHAAVRPSAAPLRGRL